MRGKRAKAIRRASEVISSRFELPKTPNNHFKNFYRKMKYNWVHRNG